MENVKNNGQILGPKVGEKFNQKSANVVSSQKTSKQKVEFSRLTEWMKNQYHVCQPGLLKTKKPMHIL